MMKLIVFCCLLGLLPCTISAEENRTAENPTLPDPALFNKEVLKKLPRLGMTLNQLRILWGNQTKTDGEATIWNNIGGVNLQTDFSPTLLTDDGFSIDPNKSRCVSITFSSLDNIPLNPGEAVKIAAALLPGFEFQYSISKKVENGPFSDPEKVVFSQAGKEKTYQLRTNPNEKGSYVVEFTITPKIVEIDTNQL